MRIVFFGSPGAAIPSLEALLRAGHAVELIVSQPDRPAGRGRKLTASPVKRLALERGIEVIQPERIRSDPAAFGRIEAVRADVHVVVAYGQIIPLSIIDLPKHKSLNVHFSLLPKYRGASPVQGAILAGESRTGVTIIRLNEKMDEGDILAAVEVPILPGENAGELESRLAALGADLLLRTLDKIGSVVAFPQDHAAATYAPKIKKEDGRIDWTSDAATIDRKVRAFTPRPSAHSLFNGRRLIILKGRAVDGGPGQYTSGEIVSVTKDGLVVACGGKTFYRIERIQPEGKKPMDAYAFSLNGRIRPGNRLD
jgi:methionyl-tRNA formyltransferase